MRHFRILIIALLCLSSLQMQGQLRWNSAYQRYIDNYKGLAINEMQRYGIPASITLAQGLLESGAGNSFLAQRGNNHFGIKCHGWTGRFLTHNDDANGECFRAYDSATESFEDHCRFLSQGSRYQPLFSLASTDYRGWARGLKAAGYATSPTYASKLIDIIETYKLYQYDNSRLQMMQASYQPSARRSSARAYQQQSGHKLYLFNENCYLRARFGDTFYSIAREVGIKAKKLAKYNERYVGETLKDGDIIYLTKKQKRAPKTYRNRPHVVKSGQSLYYISQLYGMRVNYLAKLNPQLKKHDYRITVGDRLRVY